MDHESVLEALEIAAAEPGGLDRLMAGDTPTAMAVAAHLVGCPDCTLELERWQRVAAESSEVIAGTPAPELRDRTLAYVRQYGRDRTPAPVAIPVAGAVMAAPSGDAPASSGAGAAPAARTEQEEPTSLAAARSRRRQALGWIATVAAAVVLSVVATTLLVGARVDDRLAAQDQAIEDLASVTTATLHVTSEPDVERVALAGSDATTTNGTLLYSPTTTELVVVANGLTPPPTGQEYHCWVLVDGQRQPIGKMFFGGGLAYWVGPSPAVADLPAGETFGVSLVDADGAIVGPDPVLVSAT